MLGLPDTFKQRPEPWPIKEKPGSWRARLVSSWTIPDPDTSPLGVGALVPMVNGATEPQSNVLALALAVADRHNPVDLFLSLAPPVVG